jgi:hypothetical protein
MEGKDWPNNNFPATEGDSPIFAETKIGTVPNLFFGRS